MAIAAAAPGNPWPGGGRCRQLDFADNTIFFGFDADVRPHHSPGYQAVDAAGDDFRLGALRDGLFLRLAVEFPDRFRGRLLWLGSKSFP